MKSMIYILLLFQLFAQPTEARVIEKIYAVVNGEIITLTEIEDYHKRLKTGGFVNDLLFAEADVRKKAIKNRKYLIEKIIEEKIIDYEVKKNGFVVNADRINKEINTIAKSKGATRGQLKSALSRQGVDFVDYQDFIKKSLERKQLVEKEITSKIKISEQDIVSFYLSNKKGSSSQVYEYRLSHILLPAKEASKAQQIASQLQKNSDFSNQVRKHSTDSESKAKGGHFGVFKSGEMIASIEQAIANTDVGKTSGVVKTPMGLHIFKVTDKKLVKDPEIEKAKPRIFQVLFGKAFKEQLSFWLLQKRKEAIIQMNKS